MKSRETHHDANRQDAHTGPNSLSQPGHAGVALHLYAKAY